MGILKRRHLERLTAPQSVRIGDWVGDAAASLSIAPTQALAATLYRLPFDNLLKGKATYAGVSGSVTALAAARFLVPARVKIAHDDVSITVSMTNHTTGYLQGAPQVMVGTDWTLRIRPDADFRNATVETVQMATSDGTLANEKIFVATTKALEELFTTGVALTKSPLESEDHLLQLFGPHPAHDTDLIVCRAGQVSLPSTVRTVLHQALGDLVPGQMAADGTIQLSRSDVRTMAAVVHLLLRSPDGAAVRNELSTVLDACRALGQETIASGELQGLSARSALLPISVDVSSTAEPRALVRAAAAAVPVRYELLHVRAPRKKEVPTYESTYEQEDDPSQIGYRLSVEGAAWDVPRLDQPPHTWTVRSRASGNAARSLDVTAQSFGAGPHHPGGDALLRCLGSFVRHQASYVTIVDRSEPWGA